MIDQSLAKRLIDSARSELKRWGGSEPTLTHAALVLSDTWTTEFNSVFGPGGREKVEELLRAKRFLGSEDDLARIFQDATGRVDVLTAIRDSIEARLDSEGLEGPSAGSTSRPPAADAGPPPPPAAPPVPAADAAAPSADSGESASPSAAASETGQSPAATSSTTTPAATTPAPATSAAPQADSKRRVPKGLAQVEPRPDRDFRPRESAEVAAHVLRVGPTITAVVGEKGSGRTALLGAVAAHLAKLETPVDVWRLAPDTVSGSAAGTLHTALDALKTPTVIVLDDFDDMAALATDSPNRDFLRGVAGTRFHQFAKIIIVVNKRYASRIEVISQALADCLETVTITELPPDEISGIVEVSGRAIADRHGVALDDATIAAALAPAIPADGAVHPGLALSRLDLACARAVLEGEPVALVRHLGQSATHSALQDESHDLAMLLERRVKGQPEAIIKVAERLTLTRANIDLRPDRPNGVFLFVGPTGVGKTELAKQMAVNEYGGEDRLIRLDMSEYAHDWAISRIAGPAPGYVGSTEPESWLTTKVAAMPQSVVLLDEIEKAHPRVWNLFLQVFDAGRLTDGRGVTANFADTVIVMTSNLGAREAAQRAVGFGDSDNRVSRDRLMAVVREQMAPELLNRVDEVIVFDPLSMDAITQIASNELVAACGRLSRAGWAVEWDPEVPRWLAETGYDPAYGARHLQRNIEREFLAPLATASTRNLRVDLGPEGLIFTPLG